MMIDPRPHPSSLALFWGFFTVGMFGFGGVLPWARRLVVEQRRWLTATEFTDMLGVCQFLPGGNIMNVTIALGARFQGVLGAAAAFTGLMAGPVGSVIALGVIYDRYADVPLVRQAFAGLAAAAAALVLANALKIAAPLRSNPRGIGVAAVTFGAVALFHLPLPWVLPVMLVASVALAARVQR